MRVGRTSDAFEATSPQPSTRFTASGDIQYRGTDRLGIVGEGGSLVWDLRAKPEVAQDPALTNDENILGLDVPVDGL
jgi:hypothetical protein